MRATFPKTLMRFCLVPFFMLAIAQSGEAEELQDDERCTDNGKCTWDGQVSATSTQGDSATVVDGHKQFIGPEMKPLPPLTEQDLENLMREGQTREGRRTSFKIVGISIAMHGVGAAAFMVSLIAWGVHAFASVDWGGHGDDEDDEDDSVDIVTIELIVVPVTSGAMLFGSSAVANRIGNSALWTRSRYLPIFLGGLIGWGVNTGLMFILSATDSYGAFMAVAPIGAILLPPLGEMLGYIASRRPVEIRPTRIKGTDVRHRQTSLKAQWIPPMPTLLPVSGRSHPTPGLLLGGLRF